jgi:pimeloyl-ACP methyl ester carboxylesterase
MNLRYLIKPYVVQPGQFMHTTKIGDIKLSYVVEGSGDWLVLIGGYASGHWRSWSRYLPTLAKSYRVLAFDSRGSGTSDAPEHPYTVRIMAADTLGLMDYLGIKQAHLLGRSLGGCIAQEIALMRQDIVRSLVMTSTFARMGQRGKILVQHWIDTVKQLGFPKFFEYLMTYFFTADFYDRNYGEVQRAISGLLDTPRTVHGFVNTGHAVMNHDAWDRLGNIRCPTLLLCGAEDLITPSAHSEAMGQRIPKAEVRIIPQSAHGFLTEQPRSFDLILEFLRRH